MSYSPTGSIQATINSRFREVFEKEQKQEQQQALKAVTVRLPEGYIATIDQLSNELEWSRQEFLFNILEQALGDSIKALSDLAPEDQRDGIHADYCDVMFGRATPGIRDANLMANKKSD